MSTSAGSVEELLVRISADVSGLKKGFDAGAQETKKFKASVDQVDNSIKSFRTQAVGAIQGLGGLENAMDALTGQGKLTAGTVSQLTQVLPLMATPAIAATVAMGALGVGVMKVVESERKLKENRTAALLKETKAQAEDAAKGWDAYFKAITDGQSKTGAEQIRRLAEEKARINQSKDSFLARKAALEATIEQLRESNKALEADIASWKEAGKTHGWFGRTLAQSEDKLAANNAQIKANETTIRQGYVPALRDLAAANKEVTDAEDDLTETRKVSLDDLDEFLEGNRKLEAAIWAVHNAEAAAADAQANKASHRVAMEMIREHQEEIQRTQEVYRTLGDAVADVFQDVAFEGEDMGEAVKNALKGIAMDLIRIAIARIIANAGVTGSNVAARDSTTSGFAGVATGLAAFAAIAALTGKIPAFHEGGKVGGSPGRDRVPIMAERGERVLSREQNAAYERGMGGGGQVIHFNFSSVLPPDPTQLREVLRTTIVPELLNLQRQRMI